MAAFLAALRSGRVLLMDGAMGTELQKQGLPIGENADSWNLLHPERVRAVHEAYRAAGAEVLLTNTFTINRGTKVSRESWRAALELPGGEAHYRLLALGPVASLPARREFDDLSSFQLPDSSCDSLDAVLLETCSSPRVRHAVSRIQKTGPWPVLLSLAYKRDEHGRLVTHSGHAPEWFARRARDYGLAALGVNCGQDIDVDDVIEIVRRYRQETDLPLFARPNAGTPVQVGAGWVYPQTPEAMAARLPDLLEAGVSMVGGCCGTTPAHIAAFRPIVAAWNAARGGCNR